MDPSILQRFFGVLFEVLVWLMAFCTWALLDLREWRNPIGAFLLCMLLLDQILRARRANRKEAPRDPDAQP